MRSNRIRKIQDRSPLRSGLALVVLGIVSLSCSAITDETSLTVDYISIPQSVDGTTGGECYASKAGTSVIIKEGGGGIVGTGRAGVGTWEAHPDGVRHDCVHRITVDVGGADYYVVSIEGLGGELTYSQQELDAADWSIAIG